MSIASLQARNKFPACYKCKFQALIYEGACLGDFELEQKGLSFENTAVKPHILRILALTP